MWNDRAILARKQSKNDRKFPQMMGLTHMPVRDRLLNVIKREFEPLRFATEMLARAAKKTPRAARNWLSGTNAPDAEALIELMASSNAIAAEVERLVAERRKAREEEECPGSNSGFAGSSGSERTTGHHHLST